METFRDFYSDISMTVFKDDEFIKLVSETWGVQTDSYTVNAKDIEHLIAAMRHNLLKYGSARKTEEYILRDIFRDFDRGNSACLGIDELRSILVKINICTEDKYIRALLGKFDANENGQVEFDEFVRYVVDEPYHKY
jgi:Ca2+-binding EF-hand superfamily protein